MKKLVIIIIILALVAVFVIVYFSVDEVNYNVDMTLFHIFDKGDGLYCSPHRCVDLIHSYNDLYHYSMNYMKLYGPEDPGRPSANYQYNNVLHAYVKNIKWDN